MGGKDFREGWTVKSGPGATPWHYFHKGEKRSVCGSWTRDGTGILAGIHGVGKGGHCKSCLKICRVERPPPSYVEGVLKIPEIPPPPKREAPKVEIRHIEISILDEREDTVFTCSGTVSRKTSHKLMEYVGLAFIPVEPPRALVALPPPMRTRISCDVKGDCTDYPKKCSECHKNMAKSYFKPKEE